MPGVSVTTQTRGGPNIAGEAPAATFFVAGLTERGPSDKAVRVRSLAEYEEVFGKRVSYGHLYDALKTFFAENGFNAYVTRVVGDAASVGSLQLVDRAGTPLPTIQLDAVGAGSWSSGVTAEVANGTVTGTFKVIIKYDGATEVFDNLSTPADAVARINARDTWVTATDLGSATAAPANQPAVVAATPLSAGADDRASVVAQDYVDALDTYALADLGAGAVAVPGQVADDVGAGLIAHAKERNRLALLAVAQGDTQNQAIASAQALRSVSGSEHAGVFYPWVKIPDTSGVVGATLTVPPEAFVAAARARAHLQEGPWRAPGGRISAARFVTDVNQALTSSEANTLDDSEVNAIRIVENGVRLYGWRSLSSDEDNYRMLTGRDVLNYLVVEADRILEDFVFRPIDGRGHLFSDINAAIVGLVEPIRAANGLFERVVGGQTVDRGYAVDTGPEVNTPASIANNVARAALSVRVAPTGALIEFVITKVGQTATL